MANQTITDGGLTYSYNPSTGVWDVWGSVEDQIGEGSASSLVNPTWAGQSPDTESTSGYSQSITMIAQYKTIRLWLAGNGVANINVSSATLTQGAKSVSVKVNNQTSFYIPPTGRWSDSISTADFNTTAAMTLTIVLAAASNVPAYSSSPYLTPAAQGTNTFPVLDGSYLMAPILEEDCSSFDNWTIYQDDRYKDPTIVLGCWNFNIEYVSGGVLWSRADAALSLYDPSKMPDTFTVETRFKVNSIAAGTSSDVEFHLVVAGYDGIDDNAYYIQFNIIPAGIYTRASGGSKLADTTVGSFQTLKLEYDITTLDYTEEEKALYAKQLHGMTDEEYNAFVARIIAGIPGTMAEYYEWLSVANPYCDVYMDSGSGFEYINRYPYATMGLGTERSTVGFMHILAKSISSGGSLNVNIDYINIYRTTALEANLVELSGTGTITINTNPSVGETITISNSASNVFTFVDHYPNDATEIQIGATTAATAINIAARINAIAGAEFVAKVDGSVITVIGYTSTFAMTTTSAGITISGITETKGAAILESASVADSITVVEGGKATQENASVADSTDGLIDGLTESAGVDTSIDCLNAEMDEGIGATALSDNFDGLIEYMGEEIT